MAEKSTLHKGVLRFIIIFILSMGVIWIFSEGTHWLLREDYDRNPQVVELVVPLGAAQRVAAGEPVPSIPDEMIFVVGDTLTVKNEDSVDHELGPLWVPAGSSASLVLDQPRKFMYTCSFQDSRYLGIDVRQPTTWTTRITALAVASPATAIFIFVYSLLVWPIKLQGKKGISNTGISQISDD
jgi:hypothetical protein